ncbi:matrixin family metalloprotease [Hyunsoonleella sp. SJ7]|uniref:Matrixin family metalloprotease n=1 Tax=Hyunsoonleella aquatilis TaxID=2762758 RepID=A0A923HGB3_9FLAO|nr:M57 family metalloprotease [Hyunsoonleella aquatilis]MBC3758850.1 matrixin family metalloprotease [Hyunsoonleella aquatilis]
MKNSLLIILIIAFLGCKKHEKAPMEKPLESYVSFEILDTISTDSPIFDLGDIQAVQEEKNTDSIMHETIEIDSENYYIVEGDLLYNEFEYYQYRINLSMQGDSISSYKEGLVGEKRNNEIVKWPENFIIKYSIMKNSFASDAHYNQVKTNMKLATADWTKACNVEFTHDESKDNLNLISPNDDLTFIILGFNTSGQFIASAFFPYYPKSRRRVLIDPSYFETRFNRVGVLRHELGHVLGFRHEHIRSGAPRLCPNEDLRGTFNITNYDPKSVMHYFCGGMGSIELEITNTDRIGASSIYGASKN